MFTANLYLRKKTSTADPNTFASSLVLHKSHPSTDSLWVGPLREDFLMYSYQWFPGTD